MMHKVLSTENIAEFARGTLQGLKRFMSTTAPTQGGVDGEPSSSAPDFAQLTKIVEEQCLRGKFSSGVLSKWVDAFTEEVRLLTTPPLPPPPPPLSSTNTAGSSSSLPGTPPHQEASPPQASTTQASSTEGGEGHPPSPQQSPSSTTASSTPPRKQVSEHVFVQAFDCLRKVYQILGEEVSPLFLESSVFTAITEMIGGGGGGGPDGSSSTASTDILPPPPQMMMSVGGTLPSVVPGMMPSSSSPQGVLPPPKRVVEAASSLLVDFCAESTPIFLQVSETAMRMITSATMTTSSRHSSYHLGGNEDMQQQQQQQQLPIKKQDSNLSSATMSNSDATEGSPNTATTGTADTVAEGSSPLQRSGSPPSHGSTTTAQRSIVPRLRLLMVLYVSLKRADIVSAANSNEVKSRLAQFGAIQDLMEIAYASYQNHQRHNNIQQHQQQQAKGGTPTSSMPTATSSGGGAKGGGENPHHHRKKERGGGPGQQVLDESEEHEGNLTVGMLSMAVLCGLARSNFPNKEELRGLPQFAEVWPFYASVVGRVQCSVVVSNEEDSQQHQHQLQGGSGGGSSSGKGKNPSTTFSASHQKSRAEKKKKKKNQEDHQHITCETNSVWASELVELIIELCSTDSFSLRRQAMYADLGPSAQTPTNSTSSNSDRSLGGAVLPPRPTTNPFTIVRKWEPLPTNWDAILASGALFVWRLASSTSDVVLQKDPTAMMLTALKLVDTTSEQSELVLRGVLATLVLLCRSSPKNATVLSEARIFQHMVGLMTSNVSVFHMHEVRPQQQHIATRTHSSNNNRGNNGDHLAAATGEDAGEAAEGATSCMERSNSFFNNTSLVGIAGRSASPVLLGHPAWSAAMGIITVICTSSPTKEDIEMVLDGVETMITEETSAEDCEIIEHFLHVIGTTVKPNRDFMWFNGLNSEIVCSVDKCPGRWYGYSFLCWVNPTCVWSEGAQLYSYSDPSTDASTAIVVVANGRTKCLAVRAVQAKKELTVIHLPEAKLSDDWSHIAIVHNITNGFMVFINGKKVTLQAPNVNFPKEPAKPHKLKFTFGGGMNDRLGVPPLFGMMTAPQLMDGSVTEKEVERLASAGPGSFSSSIEPNVAVPELLTVAGAASTRLLGVGSASSMSGVGSASNLRQSHHPTNDENDHENVLDLDSPRGDGGIEIRGSGANRDAFSVASVVHHCNPNVPQAMKDLRIIDRVLKIFTKLDNSPNRNSVAVLCLEILCAYTSQVATEGLQELQEKNVLKIIGKVLLGWGTVPPQIPAVLFALTHASPKDKSLRQHKSTTDIFRLVMDLLYGQCPAITRSAVLKELSDLLTVPTNVRLFKESNSKSVMFSFVLELSRAINSECIEDLISVVEKLIKEPAEMEIAFRYLVHEPESKQSTVMKCELLRMLYDVAKPHLPLIDCIASVGGVSSLLRLVHGNVHSSEAIRVYAMRLLALVLHCNRKQRELFIKTNGFDNLAEAIKNSCKNAPPGLHTYNCLFKMALDFFQPNNNDVDGSVLDRSRGKEDTHLGVTSGKGRHGDPSAVDPRRFHGHMPAMVPRQQGTRRVFSFDVTSMNSECSDVEARLSIDDNYNSQAGARDFLAHPQCISIVLDVLGYQLEHAPQQLDLCSNLDGGGGCGGHSDTPDGIHSSENASQQPPSLTRSSHRDDEELASNALKVLGCLDGIVDLSRNAVVLLPFPWMEWIWKGTRCILQNGSTTHRKKGFVIAVEAAVRGICRKIAVADICRPKGQTHIKKVKELLDIPILQQIVVEEVVRHFSTHNRLDRMEAIEATNVIRNLEALFQQIDDVFSPFPIPLGLEIVHSIGDIAVHNDSWVRQKMKNGSKLFEIRDRLSFFLLSSVKDFHTEEPSFIRSLLEVNMHDPNATLYLLKLISESVKDRSVEAAETLQGMLRTLYSLDEEHRRIVYKTVVDPVVIDVLITQRKIVDGAEVPMDELITWSLKSAENTAKWEQFTSRVTSATKSVDTTLTSRAEKREKERGSKMKIRRIEVEKRNTMSQKSIAEYELVQAEVDGRVQQYVEGINEVVSGIAERATARNEILSGFFSGGGGGEHASFTASSSNGSALTPAASSTTTAAHEE